MFQIFSKPKYYNLKIENTSNGIMVTDLPFKGGVMTDACALHNFERGNMKGNLRGSEV